jgi:hypothetical protein
MLASNRDDARPRPCVQTDAFSAGLAAADIEEVDARIAERVLGEMDSSRKEAV